MSAHAWASGPTAHPPPHHHSAFSATRGPSPTKTGNDFCLAALAVAVAASVPSAVTIAAPSQRLRLLSRRKAPETSLGRPPLETYTTSVLPAEAEHLASTSVPMADAAVGPSVLDEESVEEEELLLLEAVAAGGLGGGSSLGAGRGSGERAGSAGLGDDAGPEAQLNCAVASIVQPPLWNSHVPASMPL